VFAAVMGDAGQHSGTPQRPIGVDVQWGVTVTSRQCRRPRPVITGDLRHGLARPGPLPRRRLPGLTVTLPLILAVYLLVFVVRDIEA
jgi:hypothetical protein